MAASARRIGRPEAAEVIATGALTEPSQLVWISREARRVIRDGAQQGPPARRRKEGDHVKTVVDASTDASVALVTEADLRRIARYLPSALGLQPELRVTPPVIAHLKRRRAPGDPVAMLANALGAADEVVLRLRPDPPAVPTLL
jgi:hypothetical protein